MPEGLDLVEAAALPETFMTVWSNVFQRAALAPGESLLVHGGGGGIGTTAIQIGSSTRAKRLRDGGFRREGRRAGALGATGPSTTASEDFASGDREATGGKGADVILDMIGGDYIVRDFAPPPSTGGWSDRLPQGQQGGNRSDAGDAEAADADRLDVARAVARGQGAIAKAVASGSGR